MFIYTNTNDPIHSIKYIIETGYKIIPPLLGLSFAGFGVILSIGGSAMVSKFVDNDISSFFEDNKVTPSTFQKIIAVITWAVIIQSYLIVLIVVLEFINQNYINIFSIDSDYFYVINRIVLIPTTFIFLYSIFLIPQTLLNLFVFGQLTNFVHLVDKIRENQINKKK